MRAGEHSEIVTAAEPTGKRIYRSKQERRVIAEESLRPGASVAAIARNHGVNANQIFQWRKLLREGRLDLKPVPAQLMPVRIAEVFSAERGVPRSSSGTILVELGRTRVRIEGAADPESLRLILEHLGR